LKTREQIYGNEASELLRIVTMYRCLYEDQLLKLYPGKENVIKNLLTHLAKQGRVFYNPRLCRYAANKECDSKIDQGMIAAIWVLLDFIEKIDYHAASDFPVKLTFFTDGEAYEVIHIPNEQEHLISHALENKALQEDVIARRLVLVESAEQIDRITIANVSGFCNVATDGTIRYYRFT